VDPPDHLTTHHCGLASWHPGILATCAVMWPVGYDKGEPAAEPLSLASYVSGKTAYETKKFGPLMGFQTLLNFPTPHKQPRSDTSSCTFPACTLAVAHHVRRYRDADVLRFLDSPSHPVEGPFYPFPG
jgi:hypothetical protein